MILSPIFSTFHMRNFHLFLTNSTANATKLQYLRNERAYSALKSDFAFLFPELPGVAAFVI